MTTFPPAPWNGRVSAPAHDGYRLLAHFTDPGGTQIVVTAGTPPSITFPYATAPAPPPSETVWLTAVEPSGFVHALALSAAQMRELVHAWQHTSEEGC